MDVTVRLKQVQQRIQAAAARARRDPKDITLVAVSKYAEMEQIQRLITAGQRVFGESRVQHLQSRDQEVRDWLTETLADGAEIAAQIQWHMIGHLQRNKAAMALDICSMIQSVDSLRLAEHLNELGGRREKAVKILMEVNTTGEESKNGVPLPAAIHMAEQFETLAHLQLVGLMTMARQTANPEDARQSFGTLRELFDELRFRDICGPHFQHLSMGMSGDFEIAIEEGSTLVRIGSAIFGTHHEPAIELES
jgi:pyridoxal phosphate enzyme (YggS family)